MREFPKNPRRDCGRDLLGCDKDGWTTLDYSSVGLGQAKFPTRRPPRRLRRVEEMRRIQRAKVGRAALLRIMRAMERRELREEIERVLNQLALDGEIIKHPDGTFQAKPNIARDLAARRRQMRTA